MAYFSTRVNFESGAALSARVTEPRELSSPWRRQFVVCGRCVFAAGGPGAIFRGNIRDGGLLRSEGFGGAPEFNLPAEGRGRRRGRPTAGGREEAR